jgi:hypothetical protein
MGLGVNFFDGDGLLRKYGTTKTIPNRGGEYKTYGELRELEFKIVVGTTSAFGTTTVGTVATTDVIQSDQVFFPAGVFLEEVIVEVAEACNTLTSVSVGMVQTNDRTTLIGASGGGFVLAAAQATIDTAGKKLTLITGATAAGNLMGTVPIATSAAFRGYVTARFAGTQGTTGCLIVRIRYRPNSP